MIKNINIFSKVRFLENIILVILASWSIFSALLLIRNRPVTVLIGIDANGTRLIQSANDPLIQREKLNFTRTFLSRLYVYDSDTFESQVSLAGDMMSKKLWELKSSEFSTLKERLKKEDIKQTIEIQDIREVGPNRFESDLRIVVKNKLVSTKVPLRIELNVQNNNRNSINPYSLEVENYVENQL